mmetsp:Transcript_58544/g.186598  ORF Transcript_58544/g.186598 Transcript_58544/m.186598 type:complete len:209 (-) Transcript_58544:292-918(-)
MLSGEQRGGRKPLTLTQVGTHNIRLPKESNVGDVLDDLAGKLKEAGTELRGPLRLLEVFYSKIYKDFPREEKIDAINDQYWTLRAEEVSAEEAGAGPNDRQLHVYHFHRQQEHASMIHNFGDPFLLMIGAEEPLSSIKGRIQSKLEVADEEFAKWKFAFVSHSRPEYLEEDDIVAKRTVCILHPPPSTRAEHLTLTPFVPLRAGAAGP